MSATFADAVQTADDGGLQFKMGSQTKAFTAVLILQLVGEETVSLDDPISKWVAGVPNGDEVTIRQLLNHTSGLANGFPTGPGPAANRLHRGGAARDRGLGAPPRAAWHPELRFWGVVATGRPNRAHLTS